MPQGPQRLREKFMTEEDDGIAKCESIIRQAGGKCVKGIISQPPGEWSEEITDAIEYLFYEWDYALE